MGCGGVELFGLILTLNRLSVGKKLCYRREEVFRGTAEGVGNQRNGEVGGGRVVKTIKLARPNGEYQCPVKECTNVFTMVAPMVVLTLRKTRLSLRSLFKRHSSEQCASPIGLPRRCH